MRLLRAVIVLALLVVAGLAGYAYLGDMTPERREMRVPVSLTGGTPSAVDTPAADASATPANGSPAIGADAGD